jgi:hypothetical protein
MLNHPLSVVVDGAGDLFIADTFNRRIREVSRSGIITTVAGSGNGNYGFYGDGGPATAAFLNYPASVAVDASGDLFIADAGLSQIREVSRSGIITTVAGIQSSEGYGYGSFGGDGGPATAATLSDPTGVAVDAAGDVFIADSSNNRIREFTPGTVTTVTAAPTTTHLTASTAGAVFGQPVTFTASVSASLPSTATATGSVQFQVDGVNLDSPVALINGVATSPATGTLAAGPHTITTRAVNTDGNFTEVAGSLVINVSKSIPVITWPKPANISSGTPLGSAQLDATAPVPGTFVYTPAIGTVLQVGQSQALSVTFTPTDTTDYSSVAATAAINVLIATSTSLSIPSPTATLHQALTLSATVSAPVGFAIPVGMVMFFDGTTPLGPATLNASGKASLVVSTLGLGQHSITASYAGNSTDISTTSTAAPLYVGDPVKEDFDGDGKADLVVYGLDPITRKYDFRVLTSSSGFKSTITFDNHGYGFGNAQSIPVPADYFGDGRDAYAVWYPNGLGGMTFTAVSSVTGQSISVNFGGTHDIPVIADVDGDGNADFGVYGYQVGLGYRFDFVLSSKKFDVNQQDVFNNNGYGYGNAQSIPVVADFDGSGKAGFGLYVPSAIGSFFTYVNPSANVSFTRTIGGLNDVPTAISYDGDGKADLSLYGPDPKNPGHYRYEVLTSSSDYNVAKAVTFDNSGYGYGNASSVPVVADYQGTGKADFAVYLPASTGGMEFIYQTSQTGAGVVVDLGTATDLPLTAPLYLIAKKVRGY